MEKTKIRYLEYIWNVMCVLAEVVINAGIRMVRCHLWWCMVIRALESTGTVACHEALRCRPGSEADL